MSKRRKARDWLQKQRKRFQFLKPYYKLGLFGMALTYLAAYQLRILEFPGYVRNEVIFEVASVILAVEGILVGLSPLIRTEQTRDLVAVGAGVPAIIVSLLTIVQARFQSVQLGYLSTSETTFLFQIDNLLFILLIGLYSVGVLFNPPRKKNLD